MSSFCKCKSYSHFFNKNIRVYAICSDQSFNDMITDDIVRFEQLGLVVQWTLATTITYVPKDVAVQMNFIQRILKCSRMICKKGFV